MNVQFGATRPQVVFFGGDSATTTSEPTSPAMFQQRIETLKADYDAACNDQKNAKTVKTELGRAVSAGGEVNDRKIAILLDLIRLQNTIVEKQQAGNQGLDESASKIAALLEQAEHELFAFEAAELLYQAEQLGVSIQNDQVLRASVSGRSTKKDAASSDASVRKKALADFETAVVTLEAPYLRAIRSAELAENVQELLLLLAAQMDGIQKHSLLSFSLDEHQQTVLDTADTHLKDVIEGKWSATTSKLSSTDAQAVQTAVEEKDLLITPIMKFDLSSQI